MQNKRDCTSNRRTIVRGDIRNKKERLKYLGRLIFDVVVVLFFFILMIAASHIGFWLN